MADIKDVINGLECCTYLGCHHGCSYLNNGCRPLLEKDALELLKERKPRKVNNIRKVTNICKCGECPSCGERLYTTANPNFCGHCGDRIDWKEGEQE